MDANKELIKQKIKENQDLNRKEKSIVSTICVIIAVLIATLPFFDNLFGYWSILIGVIVGIILEFICLFIIKIIKK